MGRLGRGGHRQLAGEALIRSLFQEHGRAMLAYATRLAGDRAAAEEVVQDVLLRAWREPGRLVDGKTPVRMLLLVMIREAIPRPAAAPAEPRSELERSVQ
jgi:RNA polymerase sigma-70 factor (ECF subfamily)